MPSILRWLKFSYRSPSDSVLFHNVQLSTRIMFTLLIQNGWRCLCYSGLHGRRNDENINTSTTTRKDLYFFMPALIFVWLPFVCMYLVHVLSFTFNRVFVRRNCKELWGTLRRWYLVNWHGDLFFLFDVSKHCSIDNNLWHLDKNRMLNFISGECP